MSDPKSPDVVLDIETAADMPPEMLRTKMLKVSAPKNYKDPEKIKAYLADAQVKLIDKAALSPITGKVIAVGLAARGIDGAWDYGCLVSQDGDEAALLREVDRILFEKAHGRLVTFNGLRFDLPFLVGRAMRHRLDLRYKWPLGYSSRHLDLFKILGEGSLAEWTALVLGREKSASGNDVAGMVERGEWAEVKAHCIEDIKDTVELYEALEGVSNFDRT